MKRVQQFKLILLLIINTWISQSCSRSNLPRATANESYCIPPKQNFHFNYQITSNSDSVLAANQSLRGKFSDQSILIMQVLRINDELNAILKYTKNADITTQIKVNTLKQQIDNRVWMANSEIDALSAELDCEGERIDQIAKYVDDKNEKKNTKFTVASIVIGAVSSIATVLIVKESVNKGITIGAGTLGAGLGFLTLNPKGERITLKTERNLLKQVWFGENTNQISPFVWYLLTEPKFSNSGQSSLLQNTKGRWLNYQFENNQEEAAKSVNFSNGGVYRAEDLHARSQMINQFQSVVRSIKQNLNLFIAELNTAFD